MVLPHKTTPPTGVVLCRPLLPFINLLGERELANSGGFNYTLKTGQIILCKLFLKFWTKSSKSSNTVYFGLNHWSPGLTCPLLRRNGLAKQILLRHWKKKKSLKMNGYNSASTGCLWEGDILLNEKAWSVHVYMEPFHLLAACNSNVNLVIKVPLYITLGRMPVCYSL